ncbi:MAG: methyltransferase [Candidatus Acidiferrales bacterium]
MHLVTALGLTIPPAVIILRWIAAAVLILELPVPFYWFVLHLTSNSWRSPQKLALTVAVLPWPIIAILLAAFRNQIFAATSPRPWEMFAGMAAILLEFWLTVLAKSALGLSRMVGKTEMDGDGEVQSGGIYARMRHPRCAGMIGAVVGAGLLCATSTLWIVLAIWTVLVAAAVALGERELERHFGAAYLDYCRRVPRFVPNRFRARAAWPR